MNAPQLSSLARGGLSLLLSFVVVVEESVWEALNAPQLSSFFRGGLLVVASSNPQLSSETSHSDIQTKEEEKGEEGEKVRVKMGGRLGR